MGERIGRGRSQRSRWLRGWLWQSDAYGRQGWLLLPLRGVFDVAGAFPRVEFVGVAGVFVVDRGVEVVDLFHEAFRCGGAPGAFTVVSPDGVVGAKGLDAVKHFAAAGFEVVHRSSEGRGCRGVEGKTTRRLPRWAIFAKPESDVTKCLI